jgi:hypothetical protein
MLSQTNPVYAILYPFPKFNYIINPATACSYNISARATKETLLIC